MNKRKAAIWPVLLAALLVTACGTVLAYMFKITDDTTNVFKPAHVDCVVSEATDTSVTEKTGIKVQNTGNIDAYLRVRLVSYWVRITEEGEREIISKPSVLPAFAIADGWLKGENDTYYFAEPVAPGDFTHQLLADGETIALAEEDGALQVIDVFAEAIQSRPASSVGEGWGVTLDESGTIISIPQ